MVEIRKYRDNKGRIPFDAFLGGLRDKRAQGRIQIRIDRLAIGLEGDWKSVGEGVYELRIPEGKGYREMARQSSSCCVAVPKRTSAATSN